MKRCTKCKVEKDDTQFALKKNKSGSISIRSTCRRCILDKHKERYKTESSEVREVRVSQQNKWRSENNDKVKALKAKYRLNAKVIKLSSIPHDAHVNAFNKEVADTNRKLDRIRKVKHDAHVAEWKRCDIVHARWKQKHDMSYVCYHRLKRGVYRAFRNKEKSLLNGWNDRIEFSMNELVAYIEDQFIDGMNWDNREDWCIDHIKPLCSFDIKGVDTKEFKECFSLDNLQPLWKDLNRIKFHTHDKFLNINRKVLT